MESADRAPLPLNITIIALVAVIAVAAGGAFSALVRYDLIGFGHLPRAAIFIVFMLVVFNALVKRVGKGRTFTRAHLTFVYVAILVMAGFPGQQLVTYLYLGMVGSQHYATPENKYKDTFFEYIKPWAVVSKDPDSPAVKWAFEGVPPGKNIPWTDWLVPLAAWTPFLLAIIGLQMTASAMLRRRWADEERVSFPLAQVSLDMVRYRDEKDRMPGIFRHWLFWAAFLVPVLIHSKNALHYYVPGIPLTNLNQDIGSVFPGRPWNELNGFPYYCYFEMMGITYLVPDDMGFSLWFFWIARRLMMVARNSFGIFEQQEFFEHQGIGAYLWLAALYVWYARHALKAIFEAAWRGDAVARPDVKTGMRTAPPEPMTARLAVGGFLVSVIIIIVWGQFLGMSFGCAIGAIGLYLAAVTVLTRLVSETGMFAVWVPLASVDRVIVKTLGADVLGPRNITALSYMGWKLSDTASCTMGNIMQGYKLADMAKLRPGALAGLIAAALALALFASHIPSIYAIYSHTVPGLGWWPKNAGASLPQTINSLILATPKYTPGNLGNMALGAGIVTVLQMMRQRFLWWPLHPLAFTALMGPQFMGDRYGFSIFIGWLFRRVVNRFGGYVAYRTFRHAAVGIVVGNAVILIAWTIAHYFHPIDGVLIIE